MESFSEKIYEYIRMDNLNYENETLRENTLKICKRANF